MKNKKNQWELKPFQNSKRPPRHPKPCPCKGNQRKLRPLQNPKKKMIKHNKGN